MVRGQTCTLIHVNTSYGLALSDVSGMTPYQQRSNDYIHRLYLTHATEHQKAEQLTHAIDHEKGRALVFRPHPFH